MQVGALVMEQLKLLVHHHFDSRRADDVRPPPCASMLGGAPPGRTERPIGNPLRVCCVRVRACVRA